ncbi:Cyclic nucleotide-gated cation channel alpha-3 [Phytophthora nicotianae]|uniref:Cyclic nucleotide-gated cation channel alpha-3 n=1 Tax=Phytophthora nicotianae TaxID=4792 RepID=A0A0W8CP21_PHYNI|nr:Cyclic nucleotide-gated cation channel alpha-3 [Phytophthora nicotianae]
MEDSEFNLSQRERKRQELLREAQHEIEVDKHLKQKYAEAMWASDNEASTINLVTSKTTSSVQTDASTPSTSSSTSTQGTSANLTDDINTVQQGPSLAPTNDLIKLDTDHIMYRPDVTMDEAVSAREDKQTESYKVVKHLLGKVISPFIAEGVRNDKQDDLIELIDWESTLEYIVTRMKQVDGHMRAKLALEQVEAKRAAFDALKDNVGSERLGESRDVLNSIINQAVDENMSKDSRTGDIELESKKAFIQVVKNNRSIINDKLLKDFNGKQGFIAVKKFEYLKGRPEDLKGFYINPIDFKLRRASDHRKSNAQERNMSWASSLELLFESAKTKEIELDISGTSLRSAAKRSLEDSAVSGIEIETKKPNLNSSTMLVDSAVNVDMVEAAGDYKKLIKDIYEENPWLIREYLPPAVSKINRQYPRDNYYLHFDADIRKIKGNQPNLAVDPVVTSKALKLIHVSWPLTFQGVVDYLIQAVQYYKEHPDQLKAHRFEDKLQHIHDTLRRLNIVLPDTRPPLALEDLEMTNDVRGRQTLGRSPRALALSRCYR